MKFRVTLETPRGGAHDIVLSCDVTATVGDVARALIRSGVTRDPELERLAAHRRAPVTLLVEPHLPSPQVPPPARVSGLPGGPVLLDPAAPIGASGLRSGSGIRPVLEFGAHAAAARLLPIVGTVEVLSGAQRGATFSLAPGRNVLGREPDSRIHLLDQSVSRRHAEIVGLVGRGERSPGLLLRDLGSANGTSVGGEPRGELPIERPTEVRLGDVALNIMPYPRSPSESVPSSALAHVIPHIRPPRIEPRFPSTRRELPAPPRQREPHRLPVLAMLAPMVMGAAMFAITGSSMSLIMVAFSPMMMVGSWLDGTLGERRRLARDLHRFREALAREDEELSELRRSEVAERARETPGSSEIREAIERRDELLWTRRPEHGSFLELRFGEGALPSRTELSQPARGDAPTGYSDELRGLLARHRRVAPVPVTERLDRCGAVGVAGDSEQVGGMVRSLVLQLIGLHSPHELTLACFAGPGHERAWGWLKWLPHVDPVAGPIPHWQLADSPEGSAGLLLALEALLQDRGVPNSGAGFGPRTDANTRSGSTVGDPTAGRQLPVVVVLVLDSTMVDRARLIALAERGPSAGVHLIWAADDTALLPAACRTFVDLGPKGGPAARVGFVGSGEIVPLHRAESVAIADALRAARTLCPVEDAAIRPVDESDLPGSVNLRDLHDIDLLGGAEVIADAWARSGSLVSSWRQGEEREPTPLAAVVGQGGDGRTVIDLRAHGPHALVGGTTGAGKSEFLQSWIMSLAATVSPQRVTFLLVDYKGGAAFAECAELPHTVGLVTDLSPRLVRRALTSLRAELRYREELLAQRSAKDLAALEHRSDPAAPPALIIVIDEFAALTNEVPEFVDGVVDIAQRGRSLGLHLVMATQRPAGVITDNLRANTNLRIALRMADEADSSDVIGVRDAAFFPLDRPGRAAIKIGPGTIAHFQTGYLGGRASEEPRAADIAVRALGFGESRPWDIPVEPRRRRASAAVPRDIERLLSSIVAAAGLAGIDAPRRPWLDELPALLSLDSLAVAASSSGEDLPGDTPAIGLCDDPAAQRQLPLRIPFETVGNLAVVGAGGTGKTSALLTLATALSADPQGSPVQIYAIDAAGGSLDVLRALPTVGAVASLRDAELMQRVLRHLAELIAARGPRFAAARAGGLAAFRGAPGSEREPRVFLLIDGFAAMRQAAETTPTLGTLLELLTEIMAAGRALGVHVVMTADRPSAIPATLAASLQRRLVLRLANPSDYGYLEVDGDALEGAGPGRAVEAGDAREIQLALAAECRDGMRAEAVGLAEQSAAIEALAAALRRRGVAEAPQVINAPERIPLETLPPSLRDRPVYGIETRDLAPVTLPLAGLGVVAGPRGSGLSNALRSCRAALARLVEGRGGSLDAVLLTFADDGLRQAGDWSRIASGVEEVARAADELIAGMGSRPRASQKAGAFPRSGRRGLIVVEHPAQAEETDALPRLAALAKLARRANALVLFEFETGTAGGIWELFSALKQPAWGLSLQPDEGEAQTPFREDLGRVKRADFAPGRGFAIEAGRVTPVQVALAPP